MILTLRIKFRYFWGCRIFIGVYIIKKKIFFYLLNKVGEVEVRFFSFFEEGFMVNIICRFLMICFVNYLYSFFSEFNISFFFWVFFLYWVISVVYSFFLNRSGIFLLVSRVFIFFRKFEFRTLDLFMMKVIFLFCFNW